MKRAWHRVPAGVVVLGLLLPGPAGCGSGGADPARDIAADLVSDGEDLPPESSPDLPPDSTTPACAGDPGTGPWPDTADATFLRGPFLQDVRDTHAVVVFRTATVLPDEGCVDWTVEGVPSAEPSRRCVPPDGRGQYEVRLDGLPPDAEVTYQVRAGALHAGPFVFRSAPPGNRPQRILMVSDLHATRDRIERVTSRIVAQALAAGVDFALTVGDHVDQPEEAQFDVMFDGLRPLMHRVPLFATIGNHEIRHPNYFAAFVLPQADPPDAANPELYYSFRRGNAWIGVLDILDWQLTQSFGEPFPQVEWLAKELDSEAARTARWRLLAIHLAPWGRNWRPCDEGSPYYGESSLRELLVPMARDKGVSAIFSGDFHDYEHGTMDGVELFILGGAGADVEGVTCPLPEGMPQPWTSFEVHHSLTVETGCDALTIVATDVDGHVIDRVVVAQTPGE